MPAANADYWGPKLRRNAERDLRVTEELTAAGWLVLRFWEHEDPADAAAQVEQAVRSRGPTHNGVV